MSCDIPVGWLTGTGTLCIHTSMCMDEGIALEAYASWMRGGRVMVLMMSLSGFTHEALYWEWTKRQAASCNSRVAYSHYQSALAYGSPHDFRRIYLYYSIWLFWTKQGVWGYSWTLGGGLLHHFLEGERRSLRRRKSEYYTNGEEEHGLSDRIGETEYGKMGYVTTPCTPLMYRYVVFVVLLYVRPMTKAVIRLTMKWKTLCSTSTWMEDAKRHVLSILHIHGIVFIIVGRSGTSTALAVLTLYQLH